MGIWLGELENESAAGFTSPITDFISDVKPEITEEGAALAETLCPGIFVGIRDETGGDTPPAPAQRGS